MQNSNSQNYKKNLTQPPETIENIEYERKIPSDILPIFVPNSVQMITITTQKELSAQLQNTRNKGKTIGFVPTMGALHAGHLSLLKPAMKDHPVVVVSIFVNPRQFNNPDDLKKYPRMPEQDLQMLETVLREEDLVFLPSEEEVYADEKVRQFDLASLEHVLEGAFRPGHFQGVAEVVSRLFDLVQPHAAYFGAKDLQQVAVIRHMSQTHQYHIPIISCPIVREDNGLAMSSRNLLLPEKVRKDAGILFRTLLEAKNRMNSLSVDQLKSFIHGQIAAVEPFEPEYVDIVHDKTFSLIKQWGDMLPGENYYVCIAVYAGKVRLIDNMLLSGGKAG